MDEEVSTTVEDVLSTGEDATSVIGEAVSSLDFSFSEAIDILEPMALLLAEILVYSLFVYIFYRFMARRDIITAGYNQYGGKANQASKSMFYIVKHTFVFPFMVIAWTGALVIILSLLSGEDETLQLENILLVAVALISTVRITAYIREDLSRDLAKMLPFAILGIYLVNKDYYSLDVSAGVLEDLPDHWEVIVYYTVFIVVLELIMRLFHGITSPIKIGTPIPLKEINATKDIPDAAAQTHAKGPVLTEPNTDNNS